MSARRRLVAILVTVVAVPALFESGTALGAPSQVVLQSVSAYDLDQLGLDLTTLPAGRAVGAIAADRAVAAAAQRLGSQDPAPEVAHVLATVTVSQPPQSVWVVIYPGAGAILPGSWGPYSDSPRPPTLRFVGAIVDDRTGEVLQTFGAGIQ